MTAFMYATPVRFADVDHAGIVYYPRFFHFFHLAFEELWRARIGPRAYSELLDKDRVGFPAVRAECAFQAPLRFGDTAEIEVTVSRLGGKSITFRYRIYRAAEDARPRTIAAEGSVVCAVVDLAKFVAIAVPERVIAMLADLREDSGKRHVCERLGFTCRLHRSKSTRMLERDPKTLARLQAVVTALIEHRVSTSLVDVERALGRWRNGSHSALAAHGAVLRHAARCERTVEKVTAAAGDRPEGILRDAVDAGLLSTEEFVQLVGKQPEEIESIDSLRDEDDASAPDKRRTLEALLARGPVLVHVDARRSEVSVPPRFSADASLVLRFGRNLSPAIADLEVDDEAICGTLTFAGQPFRCVLPWTAVYAAMVEGEQRGTVWPEDVPEDVLTGTSEMPPTSAAPAAVIAAKDEPSGKKRATHLKLVE